VVCTSGGVGGVPRGDKGGEGGISESQVQNGGARDGVEREPSVNPGGVEKMVWDVESGIKIACGDGKFPLGQGAAGICQRVLKVEVT